MLRFMGSRKELDITEATELNREQMLIHFREHLWLRPSCFPTLFLIPQSLDQNLLKLFSFGWERLLLTHVMISGSGC